MLIHKRYTSYLQEIDIPFSLSFYLYCTQQTQYKIRSFRLFLQSSQSKSTDLLQNIAAFLQNIIIIFFRMKTQQKIQHFLPILLLLVFTSCSVPPYIHKMPLKLTENYVYYADLYFGTDSQNITLLVDTGSRTMAIFCSLCKHGCVIPQEFKIETSPTFQNVTCGKIDALLKSPVLSPAIKVCKSECRGRKNDDQAYQCKGQLNYGSSSLASFLDYLLILDLISVQSDDIKVSSTFGCIYDQRNFDTGIWGLALSPDNQFLNQIYKTDIDNGHLEAKKLFTICTAGKSAVMNIGGVDTTYHQGQGYKMRVNPSYNIWWNINIEDLGQITYNNTVLRGAYQQLGTYGIILDSGTDFNILPAYLVFSLTNVAEQLCAKVAGCTKIDQYQVFRTVFHLTDPQAYFQGQFITFTIGGKILQTPLSNYFWRLPNQAWALALVSGEEFNFQMSILGSIWMNNFDIVFDRDNNQIRIHDISRCQPEPPRRLQVEEKEENNDDDYDFPSVRGDRMDGAEAIKNLKLKHQRGIIKMMNEKKAD